MFVVNSVSPHRLDETRRLCWGSLIWGEWRWRGWIWFKVCFAIRKKVRKSKKEPFLSDDGASSIISHDTTDIWVNAIINYIRKTLKQKVKLLIKLHLSERVGCHGEARRSYLRLDAVQTSEPEDLASSQLHLGVVDLIGALRQLLLVDLLLRDAMARLLQELQVVCGDCRDQLSVTK